MAATLNCTSLTGAMFDMCTQMFNEANPTVCEGLSFKTDQGCVNYTSPLEKLAGRLGDQSVIDPGNTAWMMISAALVMIMTPGLAMFYGGLSGQESVANTIMMCIATMCLVSVQWFLFGYSFAFGPGNDSFGSFDWACLIGITANPSGAYGASIPHYVFVAFQCMFAQITPAIICGAVVGRMKFSSYMLFVFLWTTVIYDPLAHWVWSFTVDDNGAPLALGWLNAKGAADFAGGTVIHISSGFAALACALVLGRRSDYGKPYKPHNIPMIVIGAALLWFGWFGFNAGSAGGAAGVADGDFFNGLSSFAFINTHLATCTAAFSWMVMERIFDSSPTASGAAAGVVAGLVAITPACGYVTPWASCIIGLVVSPFCFGAVKLKNKIGVDDTLDAWGVHGVGGIVGAFMTGLFADPSINPYYTGAFYGNPTLLGLEVAAIVVSSSFSFFGTLVIFFVLKKTIGIRISEEAESEGIDISEHGGKAYDTDVVVVKDAPLGFTVANPTIATDNPIASREASSAASAMKAGKENDV